MAFVQLKSPNRGHKHSNGLLFTLAHSFVFMTHTHTPIHPCIGIYLFIYVYYMDVCFSTRHLFGTSLRATTFEGYIRFLALFARLVNEV